MTDLLLETALNADQREYVSAARLCAERLLDTLTTGLEYSAAAAGQIEIENYEFSIVEVLENTVSEYAEKARSKSISVVFTAGPMLPRSVAGDARRFQQIASQLIANAIKFTSLGGVEVRVDSAGSMLRLTVTDTGIGIEPAKLESIFECCGQRGGLLRPHPGLGLGLPLVARLTAVLKGRLEIESRPGLGSTFTVSLPFAPVAASQSRPQLDCGTFQILVIEDNAVARAVISHVLRKYPLELTFAEAGPAGIQLAAGQQFDLVLMDLELPEMDGLATTARIRELPGYDGVPIVAVTASDSDKCRAACRDYGMQAFLAKPVKARELLATVRRFLPWQ
jgi:CheY-like chemotaxis protein